MTQKTKETTETVNTVKIHKLAGGFECGAVTYKGDTWLFLSDLVAQYGSGFKKYLATTPLRLRVRNITNTQTRDLVRITQFKNALKLWKENVGARKQAKANSNTPLAQPELPLDAIPDVHTSSPISIFKSDNQPSNPKEPQVDLSSVNCFYDKKNWKYSFEEYSIKQDIKGILANHFTRAYDAEGVTDETSATAVKIRKEAYCSLYNTFDNVYAPYIKSKYNKELADVGLGYRPTNGDCKFMEKLVAFDRQYGEKALETLKQVAALYFRLGK